MKAYLNVIEILIWKMCQQGVEDKKIGTRNPGRAEY